MFFFYYKINLGWCSSATLETSNSRFEEARSAITPLRCFLHEKTQCGKIARVNIAEELGMMSKNRLRWITLVRGHIWGIHFLSSMISSCATIIEMRAKEVLFVLILRIP